MPEQPRIIWLLTRWQGSSYASVIIVCVQSVRETPRQPFPRKLRLASTKSSLPGIVAAVVSTIQSERRYSRRKNMGNLIAVCAHVEFLKWSPNSPFQNRAVITKFAAGTEYGSGLRVTSAIECILTPLDDLAHGCSRR